VSPTERLGNIKESTVIDLWRYKTDSRADAGTVFRQSAVKTQNSIWHTALDSRKRGYEWSV